MQRIFILSTGRTGTLYFSRVLRASNPELVAHHETRGSRALNFLGNMELTGLPVTGLLRKVWKNSFDQSVSKTLESNNMIWAALYIADDVREAGSVVHIVRDPRTYVTSHLQLAKTRWKSALANWMPFWQPVSLIKVLSPHGVFRRYCNVWQYKNDFIRKKYANRSYCCLRYEDIFSENRAVRQTAWRELAENTGLLCPDDLGFGIEKVNASPPGPHWHSWSKYKSSILESICGDLAREYGYCNEVEWLEKLGQSR